jgi:uncharacterized protein YjiS (DUF1127 family)
MSMIECSPRRPLQDAWLKTAAKALLRRYSEHRARRRALAELRKVDPKVLKDMAIDRSEIESIVYSKAAGRRRCWTDGVA